MPGSQPTVVDMHMHVGRIGKTNPELGQMSDWYQRQIAFKVFLFYLRMDAEDLTDSLMKEMTLRTIATSGISKVVCLALDPVFDDKGQERRDISHVWVSNEYVLELQKKMNDRILLGASVHPYDARFRIRVNECVDKGAVLLKWLPSAQQIDLADARVRDALVFLATANHGHPLPLLLHVGSEYAIPTSDPRTKSYDFLSWTKTDELSNLLRFPRSKRWHKPRVQFIEDNLRAGLEAGAWIIFAHCGLPYFVSGWLGRLFEHDEFETIRRYLQSWRGDKKRGRCFCDVSAFCTPFRQEFFAEIETLPPDGVFYGSDFPTPAFELATDIKGRLDDLAAILRGEFDRIIIPEDNLLDVNFRELFHAFPGHPMFANFSTQVMPLCTGRGSD